MFFVVIVLFLFFVFVFVFAFYLRDNSGGACIAWLNDAHHNEQEWCNERLNAVCQRSIYYAGKGCNS